MTTQTQTTLGAAAIDVALPQQTVIQFDDAALDMNGVCAATTCSKPYIYKMVKAGIFPQPKKIGRKSVWMKSSVISWLEEQPTRVIA
jgi:prophage regulatory protein